jgi:hypothetical protein
MKVFGTELHIVNCSGEVKPVKEHNVQSLKEGGSIAKTKKFDRHLRDLEKKYQYTANITVDVLTTLMEVTSEPFVNYRWMFTQHLIFLF